MLIILGIIVFLINLYLLFKQLGKTIPVIEILLSIAGFQWVVAPYIEYLFPGKHFKYYMYVEQDKYMSIVVPLYIAYTFGLLFKKNNNPIDVDAIKAFVKDKDKLGETLIIIGIVSGLLGSFIPSSLGFVVYICELFMIPGIAIVYFQNKSHKWIYIVFFYLFINAIRKAMFHELIFVGLFVVSILYLGKKINLVKILAYGYAIVISLSALQAIKSEYRLYVWNADFQGNKMELFLNILFKTNETSHDSSTETEAMIDPRFNQGWIISKIIDQSNKNIEKSENTVYSSLSAIFLPRILFPDKKTAESHEIFTSMTGLDLGARTSMGPSVLGEFYYNFGFNGGMLGLFILGTFLRYSYNRMMGLQKDFPLLPLFLPVLFFQVIKAETMFYKIGNHLVKTAFLLYLIHSIFKDTFRKIEEDEVVISD
jgi:hypothetical protein